jgi:mannonate dehydratase
MSSTDGGDAEDRRDATAPGVGTATPPADGVSGAAVDRIARAEVIVCSPGRNFVTLKLTTASGLTGLGDATLNGRELAVASHW